MINKKGLSSIEILLAFVLTSIIVVSMFNVVFSFRTKQQTEATKTEAVNYVNTLTQMIHRDFIQHGVKEVREFHLPRKPGEERRDYVIVLKTGVERVLSVSKTENTKATPVDEKFVLHYDGIDYPLPNIGEKVSNRRIEYDLKFNELRGVITRDYVENTDTMFTLFIGLSHPDLGSNDYAIRIVVPIQVED